MTADSRRGDRWTMPVFLHGQPAGTLHGFGSRTYMQDCPPAVVRIFRRELCPDGDAMSWLPWWLRIREKLRGGAVELGPPTLRLWKNSSEKSS